MVERRAGEGRVVEGRRIDDTMLKHALPVGVGSVLDGTMVCRLLSGSVLHVIIVILLLWPYGLSCPYGSAIASDRVDSARGVLRASCSSLAYAARYASLSSGVVGGRSALRL